MHTARITRTLAALAAAVALTGCDEGVPLDDAACVPDDCAGVCVGGVCILAGDADERDAGDRLVPDVRTDGSLTDAAGDDVGDVADDAPLDSETDGAIADARTDSDDTDVADAADALPDGAFTVTFDAPARGDVFELGTEVVFEATVAHDGFAADELVVDWFVDDVAEPVASGAPDEDGSVRYVTDALAGGAHEIRLVATDPDDHRASAVLPIGICTWEAPETFDAEIEGTGWVVYGDAYWDPSGWLEMTGPVGSQHGAIYNPVDVVNPGDVRISFRVATGGGSNGGADGFAMSIWNATGPEHLAEIVESGNNGGCLGYGVSGGCGTTDVEGFHIEIDTWENLGDPITDPTPQNHIGITLDGDPGNHVLWAAIPSIEDLEWHTVTVEVEGAEVRVAIDESEVVAPTVVPGLEFKGGYIAFSGTTGWASNYHRFDDLRILQECLVR